MDIIRRARAMSDAVRRARESGLRVGFVPTMGALHAGHLSLIRQVHERADVTVVSVFVNPTQFGPGEDFLSYPRDQARDVDLCAQEAVDFLFLPEPDEIYPDGASTYVEVEQLSCRLEALSRPGHFRGVATVVAKLFNIVRPDIAAFGQKDAQQAILVRRMARDLFLGVEVLIFDTVRDQDGVALSSRNRFLSVEERRAASAIPRALEAARSRVSAGEIEGEKIVEAARTVIDAEPLLRVDHVELVDRHRLEPVTLFAGDALLVLAVHCGGIRLLDNVLLVGDRK